MRGRLEMVMSLLQVGQASTKLEEMEAKEEKELKEGQEMAETVIQLALVVIITIVGEKAETHLNHQGPLALTGEEIGITIEEVDRDQVATTTTGGQSTDHPFTLNSNSETSINY